jgi:hypothetical protein
LWAQSELSQSVRLMVFRWHVRVKIAAWWGDVRVLRQRVSFCDLRESVSWYKREETARRGVSE